MKLKNYPADFASAYADNPFSFEEVDESTPNELVFYNAEGDIVAARRYVGSESIDSSPKSILLRLLSPEPLADTAQCEFVHPEGRDALLSVEYDGGEGVTPEILFTSSHRDHSANSLMGDMEQQRTIAEGECDEVAFCLAAGATITANLYANGRSQWIGDYTATTNGVVVFAVSADDILSRIASFAECADFELRFAIDNRICALTKYHLRSTHHSDMRIAWLNTEGGISYHTFRLASKSLHRSSKERTTPSGREIVSVESWTEREVASEVLSLAQAAQLSEVLRSPRLWICGKEGFEPQILLSSELLLEGEGARRVSLTLRSAESQVFSV